MNLFVKAAIALLLSSVSSPLIGEAPRERPNILFILTDDQRWDSLGCYGNDLIKTPNMDRLAAEGARLDAFFVASPLCCPSRAIYLSGLFPHQTGVYSNAGLPDLPEGTETIATYLNRAGYATGFIGKAHLGGDPRRWGFAHCPVYFPGTQSPHRNPKLKVNDRSQIVKGYITPIFADAAIDFIKRHRTEKWFLWFATTAPHIPYFTSRRYYYPVSKMKPPPAWPRSEAFGQIIPLEDWASYYSTISMLDAQVGRILQAIDELGLFKDTFVLMASDSGSMRGSHFTSDKLTWYDEAIRTPALVRWPGKISPGATISSLISSIDFVPTLLDVAGLRKPGNLSGFSAIPALIGGKTVRTEVFTELRTIGLWQMVRSERWKYARFKESGEEHLYDLQKDPAELHDLARFPQYASQLLAMRERITKLLDSTRLPLPDLSTLIRAGLRWIHVLLGAVWVGYIILLTLAQSEIGTNRLLTRYCLQRSSWNGTGALLTGILLFYLYYLFPDRNLLITEIGITRGAKWIITGMTFAILMWLNSWFFIRPVQKKLIKDFQEGRLLDSLLVKRFALLSRFNFYLSGPMLLGMLGARHHPHIPSYIAIVLAFAVSIIIANKNRTMK